MAGTNVNVLQNRKLKGKDLMMFADELSSSLDAGFRGVQTNYVIDPFYYSPLETEALTQITSVPHTIIGDWWHPKGQEMVAFHY